MNNILTAEEFFEQSGTYPELAIKFAKLHVEKALKQASLNAKITYEYEGNTGSEYCDTIVDKNSILNAYPLENII